MRHGDEIVCPARAGRTAPDLGVRLQTDSGISADCVRTGEVVTMQTEIRALTLPAAGAWACARSSLLPCAISVGHWAFLRGPFGRSLCL